MRHHKALAPRSINPFISDKSWPENIPNESAYHVQSGLKAAEEARKASSQIDESLLETKKLVDRKRTALKILLLGQSESGKTSVLKNFHLLLTPTSFNRERPAWKVIIQLNIICSIRTILDVLKHEWNVNPSGEGSSSREKAIRNLRRISLGLSPLLIIDSNLRALLCSGADSRDLLVQAGSGWKERVMSRHIRSPFHPSRRRSLDHESDPTAILAAQQQDIISLWKDPFVRTVLAKHSIQLETSPGFFLNDLERIATLDYEPTNCMYMLSIRDPALMQLSDDIMRARIRTTGVEEHYFIVEQGSQAHTEVYITDVGGSRNQRASWVPFFDDVQAILFLAPLSFNQVLNHEPRINRLEDSLGLWREICSIKLLRSAILILFFNKQDILEVTLNSGAQVNQYVVSYGDQPNDVPTVTKYFQEKFRTCHHKYSPIARPFICHSTTAIDVKATTILLAGVRQSILRQHLRKADIL